MRNIPLDILNTVKMEKCWFENEDENNDWDSLKRKLLSELCEYNNKKRSVNDCSKTSNDLEFQSDSESLFPNCIEPLNKNQNNLLELERNSEKILSQTNNSTMKIEILKTESKISRNDDINCMKLYDSWVIEDNLYTNIESITYDKPSLTYLDDNYMEDRENNLIKLNDDDWIFINLCRKNL